MDEQDGNFCGRKQEEIVDPSMFPGFFLNTSHITQGTRWLLGVWGVKGFYFQPLSRKELVVCFLLSDEKKNGLKATLGGEGVFYGLKGITLNLTSE